MLLPLVGQKVCMPREGWKNLAKAKPAALIPPFFCVVDEDFLGDCVPARGGRIIFQSLGGS